MFNNKRHVAMAFVLVLGGCATNAAQTAVAPVVATASADVSKALTFYGVAKGIAQVAELSDPSLAPVVDAAIAKLDPVAAALKVATPGAASLATSAASLLDQAVALENATAKAIKAVPSK